MMARVFLQQTLVPSQEVILKDGIYTHLVRVLRCQVGDLCVLFNGQGGQFEARIQGIEKKQMTVKVLAHHALESESPLILHLGQALVRGEKMDWLIQKAVELGVHSITPLLLEKCQAKLPQARYPTRLLHWQRVMISACEQCGRNRVPTVHSPMSFATWVEQTRAALSLVLDPKATQTVQALQRPQEKSVRLLVGPESGLNAEEVSYAESKGFAGVCLGPRILRTETAALVMMSVLQAQWGDL